MIKLKSQGLERILVFSLILGFIYLVEKQGVREREREILPLTILHPSSQPWLSPVEARSQDLSQVHSMKNI